MPWPPSTGWAGITRIECPAVNNHSKVGALIRPEILESAAYAVADAGALIKLDAMENPYGWPAEIKRAWLEELKDTEVNRYPDHAGRAIKEQLREVFSLPAGNGILLGNGSDEIIQVIIMALARPGAVVMAPEPTFVMYRFLARALNLEFVGVPLLAPDFTLDSDGMLAAVAQHQPAVIFLAWPNNPTGNLFDEDTVERIIAAAPGLVIVDEAYTAFAGASFMEKIPRYDNLLVMRTLSKLGLAGLRLGYLTGGAEWIDEFEKLRLPYNINVLSQKSVAFFLKHVDVMNGQAARIRADRDALIRDMSGINGISVWPSATNFILFRCRTRPGEAVYEGLKERGILVKNLHGSHASLADCLRVTVGTPVECEQFLAALKGLLA